VHWSVRAQVPRPGLASESRALFGLADADLGPYLFLRAQGRRCLFLITTNEPLVAAWPLTVAQGPVAVGQYL